MNTIAQLNNAFNSTTTVALNIGELTVDPIYQMREKMNHDVIENYVEALDSLPPINVIEVRGRKILVDGFHRYFAFERAEREEIPALIISGTEQDATVFAMSANFSHLKSGSKPSKGDQQRAILKLLPMAIEMSGYNSSAIKKNLKLLGAIASSRTLDYVTEEARSDLHQKAKSEALRLRTELSLRDLAAHLGMHHSKVSNLIKEAVEERAESANAQNAHPASIVEATPIEDTESFFDEEACPFDADELAPMPVINPADAKSKALSQLEEGLSKDAAALTSSVKFDNGTTLSGSANKESSTALIRALEELTSAWKHSDKEDIASFLNAETTQLKETINTLLEVTELISNKQEK